MKKFVYVLMLALALAFQPLGAVAESFVNPLRDTVWAIDTHVFGYKLRTTLHFYEDVVCMKYGHLWSSYELSEDGRWSSTFIDSDDGERSPFCRGTTLHGTINFNRSKTMLWLLGDYALNESKLLTPIHLSMRRTQVKLKSLRADIVPQGELSTVSITANESAECYIVKDETGKVLHTGALEDGSATFRYAFSKLQNVIFVQAGLADREGQPVESTFTAPRRLMVRTRAKQG